MVSTHFHICFLLGARFTFDHVYDQDSSQEQVYRNSAQHVVLSILQVRRVWGSTAEGVGAAQRNPGVAKQTATEGAGAALQSLWE